MAISDNSLRRYVYRLNKDKRGDLNSVEMILRQDHYKALDEYQRLVARSFILNGAPYNETPVDEVEYWHRRLVEKPEDGRRKTRKELIRNCWEYKTTIWETRVKLAFLLASCQFYIFYPGSKTYERGIPEEYEHNEHVTFSYEPIDHCYTPQELRNGAYKKDEGKPQNALVVIYEFDGDKDAERKFKEVFERLD